MIQQKTRIYYSLAGLLLFSHINMSAMFYNYMFDTKKALYIGGLALAAGLGSLGMYLYQNKGIKQYKESLEQGFNTVKDSCEQTEDKQEQIIRNQELMITRLQERLQGKDKAIDTLTAEMQKLNNEKTDTLVQLSAMKSILETYRSAIQAGELTVQSKGQYGFINTLRILKEQL
ncbi:MAG TPA: hypothetical protein VGW78_00600 [Candidatus Babeliales bacterium]|jgi:hypothetical protein|nr:hypothetical protein [Candidatus Babeliales bacterium]